MPTTGAGGGQDLSVTGTMFFLFFLAGFFWAWVLCFLYLFFFQIFGDLHLLFVLAPNLNMYVQASVLNLSAFEVFLYMPRHGLAESSDVAPFYRSWRVRLVSSGVTGLRNVSMEAPGSPTRGVNHGGQGGERDGSAQCMVRAGFQFRQALLLM